MEPGIANTSRPCVPASRAVISEPLLRAASTTSVPSARPLISRLRRGKFASQRALCRAEIRSPAPRPARDAVGQAGVLAAGRSAPARSPAPRWCGPPPSSAPCVRRHRCRCQSAGDGEARAARGRPAKSRAVRTPAAVGLRLPTMASCGVESSAAGRRAHRAATGAAAISPSSGGYCALAQPISATPALSSQRRSLSRCAARGGEPALAGRGKPRQRAAQFGDSAAAELLPAHRMPRAARSVTEVQARRARRGRASDRHSVHHGRAQHQVKEPDFTAGS